jgi:hypothetical protein
VKAEVETELTNMSGAYEQYQQLKEIIPAAQKKLEDKFGKGFTTEDIEAWKPSTPEDMQMKQIGMYIASGELTTEAIEEGLAQLNAMVNYQLVTSYNDREFIGDDPDNFNDVMHFTELTLEELSVRFVIMDLVATGLQLM